MNNSASLKKPSAFGVRQMTGMAMLAAAAFIVVLVVHMFPLPKIAGFLSYDPKDVVLAMGGFMFGAVPATLMTIIVSLLELVTVSSTGIWGFIMNVLATCAFIIPAAICYKRSRTIKSATYGLALGVVAMTAVMLLWNYLITPIYMGVPREVVTSMLLPTFLPFNLIKAGLNAALTMLIYKPVVNTLRKAHLAPESISQDGIATRKSTMAVVLVTLVTLATFALLMMVMMGVI